MRLSITEENPGDHKRFTAELKNMPPQNRRRVNGNYFSSAKYLMVRTIWLV
jgi:hypothetical protein